MADAPALIPLPNSLVVTGETCRLGPRFRCEGAAGAAAGVADLLARDLLRARGWSRADDDRGAGAVRLALDPHATGLGDEGYRLRAGRDGVAITAAAPAGLFYGTQTLRQLLGPAGGPGAPARFPGVVIHDRPRLGWRGLHLDVSRHFFPAARVMEAIDWCAAARLNRFHWHLTDDQGWRVPLAGWPRLTQAGAWRDEPDGTLHGGWYREEEIAAVLAHAAERFVTVVPELDLPGHARAILAAYPDLSCRGEPLPVPSTWGVFEDVLCAGSDDAVAFAESAIDELSLLFPGPWLHVGGDEVPATRWLDCPRCRARMAGHGLDGAPGLQAWFTRRATARVRACGRTPVGWDEIAEGGLEPGRAVIMAWRSTARGAELALAGHPVVMCPMEHCYLDSYQGPRDTEPPAFPRDVPLDRAYAFEPVPPGLPPEAAERILGGQANVWTEHMPDWSRVESMVFPRLHAIAEALWTEPSRRDFADFSERLGRLAR